MPTSDEYRKTADDCYRLALEAKSETDRRALLDLANTWLETASRQDEMTIEQIAEAQNLERARKSKPDTPKPQTPLGRWQRVFRFFRPDENAINSVASAKEPPDTQR
jgi:hypothetical protein